MCLVLCIFVVLIYVDLLIFFMFVFFNKVTKKFSILANLYSHYTLCVMFINMQCPKQIKLNQIGV